MKIAQDPTPFHHEPTLLDVPRVVADLGDEWPQLTPPEESETAFFRRMEALLLMIEGEGNDLLIDPHPDVFAEDERAPEMARFQPATMTELTTQHRAAREAVR